jgi:hypothetical protein
MRSRHYDYLNRKGLRNVDNTDEQSYNCGGYALGCFSWYRPCGVNFSYGSEEYGSCEYIGEERATEACVRAILKDFPQLRVIADINDVPLEVEVIAFRIGQVYDDFHFMVRRHGRWTHKMGNGVIRRITEDEVLYEHDWFNKYYGRLILFAKE